MTSAGDAEVILSVDATVARSATSAAEPTMADMAAQLQEAKVAALAAADRMATLLKQMEVMEAAAAKRRLDELAIQERIAATAAAASSTAAAAGTGAANAGSAAEAAPAPPDQAVQTDDSKPRQITMTDVYGEEDDKAGQVRTPAARLAAQRS